MLCSFKYEKSFITLAQVVLLPLNQSDQGIFFFIISEL